ncbi:MAG: DUF2726 domain-containing protein [Chloroflexota bacterium]
MQRSDTSSDNRPDGQHPNLPFRLRVPFISADHLEFYAVLQELMGERFTILAKVSLGEIVTVARPNQNVQFYNRIFRKNVDFLLCEPRDLRPVMGVQLVRSQGRDDIRHSESFIQDVFAASGLPLVCVPLSEKYSLSDLMPLFELAMVKVQKAGQARSAKDDFAPICPRCGISMVLRIYRDGPKAGMQYYGCLNAPECKEVTPI